MNKALRRILGSGEVDKKPIFTCLLAICTHRDVKVRVLNQIRALEKCPDPKIVTYVMEGDALISRARNRVATKFLRDYDYDMLFFIDDDVIIDTFDATKIMWDCWQNKRDITGAAYPLKKEKEPGFAIRPYGDGLYNFGKHGSVIPMRWISSGCMCIRRETLARVRDHANLHLCDSFDGMNPQYAFFNPMEYQLENRWYNLSEDWAFAQRVLDAGMNVWCDTTVKLKHVGPKEYDWDDFFQPQKSIHENPIYEVKTPKPISAEPAKLSEALAGAK